jgi:hypothetical protein
MVARYTSWNVDDGMIYDGITPNPKITYACALCDTWHIKGLIILFLGSSSLT